MQRAGLWPMMRFHGRTGRGGQNLPSSYLASTRQGAQVAVTLASAARHPGALCCALSRPVLHVLTVAQLLSRVGHFAAPWTATRQASLPITNSQSLLRLVSIEWMMPSNHLVLCHPFLLASIFPSIRVFSSELTILIRWPKSWSFNFSFSPFN